AVIVNVVGHGILGEISNAAPTMGPHKNNL
ncbi:MAG: hypothetical protein ACI9OW_001539, partial [Marinobacter psychrophilus]